jgi:hypothetical protein
MYELAVSCAVKQTTIGYAGNACSRCRGGLGGCRKGEGSDLLGDPSQWAGPEGGTLLNRDRDVTRP